MIEHLVTAVASFFLAAVSAATAQNLLLTRGFGLDQLIRAGDDEEARIFCLLQGGSSLLASVGFWAANRTLVPLCGRFLQRAGLSEYYAQAFLWPLASALVLVGVFFLVFVLCVKFAPYENVLAAVRRLPFAAFNTFVSSVMLISASKAYAFWQMLALTVGSSIGYMAVSSLLCQAERKLKNREMPAAFRGLPAKLLYLSGLAMAAWALTGHGFTDLL